MSKLLVPLFFSILISACISEKQKQLPISEDSMVELIFDIHVAEAAISPLQAGERKDSLANKYYDQIAEIHQIDRETIDSCLAILQRNPAMAKVVYDKVAENVEKRRLVK
jgi:Domain of unknown function (DUF4296)